MADTQAITDINQYRMQRRRAGSIRWVLILVFLVVCLFAGYFFARSGFFTIDDIIVEGNSQVSVERIIQLAGIQQGENIFSFTPGHATTWLGIEPRVLESEVRRRLPGTVVITVVERQAVAALRVDTALIEIDVQGRVLSRYPVSQGLALPLISGLDLSGSGTIPGAYIKAEGINAALNILQALPEGAEGIGEIDVGDPQFICLYTKTGTEIRLGDSANFAEKYVVYSSVLADIRQNSNKALAYVDVSIYTDPVIKYR